MRREERERRERGEEIGKSERVNGNNVVTICGDKGCCPTIDFSEPKVVIIKDDFGGRVRLTRTQWSGLKAVLAPRQRS